MDLTMMAAIRRWHSYLGILIAPSVLFFALTGALQLFSLHESHGDYRAPAIIVQLASLHKDQAFKKDERAGPADTGEKSVRPANDARRPPKKSGIVTVLLKSFFLLVALGLSSSTILGLWMALNQHRRKRIAWTLLGIGAAIPAFLTAGLFALS